MLKVMGKIADIVKRCYSREPIFLNGRASHSSKPKIEAKQEAIRTPAPPYARRLT